MKEKKSSLLVLLGFFIDFYRSAWFWPQMILWVIGLAAFFGLCCTCVAKNL